MKKVADAQAAKLVYINQNLRTLIAKANATTAMYVKAQGSYLCRSRAKMAAQYAAETTM